MENYFAKCILISCFFLVSSINYAQMPPHPSLLEKINQGEQAAPYALSISQFSEQELISLANATGCSAWGDYDNDGDLDILLTGLADNFICISKLYRNNGDNTFTEQTSISLTGVMSSSAAWGDYDNDGYLDILLTGENTSGLAVSMIYHNNGNSTFSELTSISLPDIKQGSVVWGDYDNDGKIDILLSGWSNNGPISKIYRNNGNNNFSEQTSIPLEGVSNSSVAWGDYNNDGYLDILLTGENASGLAVSKIYRNNGNGTFSEQTLISLTGVSSSSAAWGDYDNDGYLDIVLTGTPNAPSVSKIYHNNGNNTFTEQTSIFLTDVYAGNAIWGDYDNDSNLDILLSGFSISENKKITKIYRNVGNGSFAEQTQISLTGFSPSAVSWGDYDNDNDLDFLVNGASQNGRISKIYRNNNAVANMLPSVPSNLKAVFNRNYITLLWDVTFSWDKCTDNETPQNGLTYNLVIGTSPGAYDILSPMSDINSGKRRIVKIGNAGHCISKTIKGLTEGEYYWSVQAIDNCYAGSNFAPSKSFEIGSSQFTEQGSISLIGVTNSSVAWGDYDNDSYLDILLTGSVFFGGTSKIYHNNGDNTFSENSSINLKGVSYSSASWSDYDNDGNLDILIAGYSADEGKEVTKIYRNNGNGSFIEQTQISLLGVSDGSAVWGDYNNDGYKDILLTGSNVSKIYHNNANNTFSEMTTIPLIGISNGSATWGDYDNDGYLDILLVGYSITENGYVTKIYRNNGNGSFTDQKSILLTGIYDGLASWGDYDNDGYLDILLVGDGQTKIYHNNKNNTFTEETSTDFSYASSGTAWGDYDDDGDLDILKTGQEPIGLFNVISEIYRNNNLTSNVTPSIPTNLKTIINGNEVTLSWDKSTDNETPQNGLTYNLVIGTSPGACNILSPMSDRNTGYRKVVGIGNAGHKNSWTIKDLPDGQYYWSVQAIDNTYAGSQFAEEKNFTILKKAVYAKVFLQGPNSGGTMNTTLQTSSLIPTSQPYSCTPWNYNGTESLSNVPSGVVDWVLVELRSDISTAVQTRAAFLMSDGSIHDIDGSDHVNFNGIPDGSYYIVIKHRNHLSVMSASAVSLPNTSGSVYDFTTGQAKVYGTNPMIDLGGGKYGMVAGDANDDGQVTTLDYNSWLPNARAAKTGCCNTDVNLDGLNTTLDYNLWLPNARAARKSQVP